MTRTDTTLYLDPRYTCVLDAEVDMKNYATSIIEDKLDVSYEAADEWVSEDGKDKELYPESAVLLVTRCCQINHDHISLTPSQANVLARWLTAFVNGEYNE